MNQQSANMENEAEKSTLCSRAEEKPVTALETEKTRTQILRHGHRGILTMDPETKMESVTTVRAAYVPPKSPGVRLRGVRDERLRKDIAQMISEKIQAERTPTTVKTDFCSTTRRDFSVEGFVPHAPETTQVHDYKTDQAITFWSENRQRIQGTTAAHSPTAPFRKSALFSTPITERLDEIPPDS